MNATALINFISVEKYIIYAYLCSYEQQEVT
jgi:hypothetical protein